MVASTSVKPFARTVAAGAVLLVAALAPAPASSARAFPPAILATSASVAAFACPAEPIPPIAETPWPQRRYDLAAVRELSDGAGVTVAVIDSGVDASHPQLAGAVVAGIDRLGRGDDGRADCVGHGTAVASIIAGRPMPGVSFHGLAPAATILPVRVSERVETDGTISGEGNISDLAAGIRAAVASRPRPAVMNLSISTTADHPELRAAIREALAADIVVVAAVGNQHERGDPAPYPASYDGVVGVGAIDETGQRLAQSQVGSYVDIVAPGGQVLAAAPGDGHLPVTGTSFAVPYVAATAALIRSRYPSLSRTEVVARLLATADPAPGPRPSPQYGYGVLNPLRALAEVVPGPGAGVAPAEEPVILGPDPAPITPAPSTAVTLGAASMLVLAAAAVAAVAAAVPLGRRRRWRPDGRDFSVHSRQ